MHTNLSLFPRSRNSFDVNDIEGFAEWLLQRDYRHEQTRNTLTEYARLRGANGGLITIYYSGGVVLGGSIAGVSTTLALISSLILSDDVAPVAIRDSVAHDS